MTIGSHQRTVGKSQAHITPRWIIDCLGPFDLDPCAASKQPWRTAERQISLPADGLAAEWKGRVWLNPPFNRYQIGAWVEKLAAYGRGTLLIHARTETEWFRPIWDHAGLILFLGQRIKFYSPAGKEQRANSGAPIVIAAFGALDISKLDESKLKGAYVWGWSRNK